MKVHDKDITEEQAIGMLMVTELLSVLVYGEPVKWREKPFFVKDMVDFLYDCNGAALRAKLNESNCGQPQT